MADLRKGLTQSAWATLLVFALTACGGGGSGGGASTGPAAFGGGGSGAGGGDASTGGDGSDEDQVISFGAMIDGTFVLGAADVSVDTLSAGGTAEVTVNLVDQNGNPITETFTVSFTSGCVADGTATLETAILTTAGQASSEYVANGCVGADEIRATVDIDGTVLTAVGTITVAQENIGSIEFVSAAPNQIALSGTGGDETSRVTFRVVGEAGGPIQDATVTFALNSSTGGLDLTNVEGTSNSAGEVSTIVQAGTIATSVRVTATEQSTGISTQSSQLTVSTGIPDSDSFSTSVSCRAVEGLRRDGEEISVVARAADAFNNPVPENTAISFFTEGGSIDPTCATDGSGACTVVWRSQDPRPANGRVTILTTAIGNESFTDQNGNGRFDDGEAFIDLGEAYADENENNSYDLGEFFIDFGPGGSPDGMRNVADTQYNGVLCADGAASCSADRTLIVSEQEVIVMSGIPVEPVLTDGAGTPVFMAGGDIDITTGATLQVFVNDELGNSLAGGTTVAVSGTDGVTVDGSGSSFTVGCQTTDAHSAAAGSFLVTKSNAAQPLDTNARITVTFTSPSGDVRGFNFGLTETN